MGGGKLVDWDFGGIFPLFAVPVGDTGAVEGESNESRRMRLPNWGFGGEICAGSGFCFEEVGLRWQTKINKVK